jgi:hypothetical protein
MSPGPGRRSCSPRTDPPVTTRPIVRHGRRPESGPACPVAADLSQRSPQEFRTTPGATAIRMSRIGLSADGGQAAKAKPEPGSARGLWAMIRIGHKAATVLYCANAEEDPMKRDRKITSSTPGRTTGPCGCDVSPNPAVRGLAGGLLQRGTPHGRSGGSRRIPGASGELGGPGAPR